MGLAGMMSSNAIAYQIGFRDDVMRVAMVLTSLQPTTLSYSDGTEVSGGGLD